MTPELAKILTDIESLIGDWKSKLEADESTFLDKLKILNDLLTEELKKPPVKVETE